MFWVYLDTALRRVRIHRSECPQCQGGQGLPKRGAVSGPVMHFWEEFPSYGAARQKVEQLRSAGITAMGSSIDCRLCRPDQAKDVATR